MSLLCVTGQEFGVETDVVQADFMNGRPIYEDIAKHLQDKEIGILGESRQFAVSSLYLFSLNILC